MIRVYSVFTCCIYHIANEIKMKKILIYSLILSIFWNLVIGLKVSVASIPATTFLSSTASVNITSTTSWQLVTTAPASSNVTTSVKQAKNTGFFQWQPGVASTAAAAGSAPTTPDGKGFIFDTAMDSTVPSGTWTFNVQTKNNTSSSTGTGHVVVCAWKVTVSGGAITASSQIFACQEGATNVVGISSTSLTASSVSVASVGAQSFTASQFLYVEYWLRETVASSSTSWVTAFQANAGSADQIVLPGASSNSVPSAPTLNSPANSATGVSSKPTFLITTTDPESDALQYKVLICSNSSCSSVLETDDQSASQTGWSGQNATCTSGSDCYSSGTQASFTEQNGLAANTQFWWEAFAKDPKGSNTFSTVSAIQTFTTGVAQTLTFSISTNSIGFGNLSSTAATFANAAGTGSSTEVEAHTLSASTNATSGYIISVLGPTLTSAAKTIAAIGATAAASSPGTAQFGFRLAVTSGTGTATAPYNTANFADAATAGASSQVASGAGDGTTTIFSVHYICNISSLTSAGSYSTNLNYLITGKF